MSDSYLQAILKRFKQLRESKGVAPEFIEEKLILGPGWVNRFETGLTTPSLDMLFAMLNVMEIPLPELLQNLEIGDAPSEIERHIYAVPEKRGINIHFNYNKFDAIYKLDNASNEQFEKVIKVLRDGLARLSNRATDNKEALKTEAVAKAFLEAVKLWPKANPSDLWYFLVYRAYCDPFNHPAEFARLSFDQSWKRTGGWALEEVLVRHYQPYLKKHGIHILIGSTEEKETYLKAAKSVVGRLEADKADVILLGENKGKLTFFGVVHVKASFAERRTDDVPMSIALVNAGYTSPLWTMDCKSTPSASPVNRGELGEIITSNQKVSAKRKDIEEDGFFSACFSYNKNTKPTPSTQKAKARIHVCDFSNLDDEFSKFIIQSWHDFRHK